MYLGGSGGGMVNEPSGRCSILGNLGGGNWELVNEGFSFQGGQMLMYEVGRINNHNGEKGNVSRSMLKE